MSENKQRITVGQLQNAFGNIARISFTHSQLMNSSVNLACFYAEHCCAVFAMHLKLPPSELLEQIMGNAIVKAAQDVYHETPLFEKSKHGEVQEPTGTPAVLDK